MAVMWHSMRCLRYPMLAKVACETWKREISIACSSCGLKRGSRRCHSRCSFFVFAVILMKYLKEIVRLVRHADRAGQAISRPSLFRCLSLQASLLCISRLDLLHPC